LYNLSQAARAPKLIKLEALNWEPRQTQPQIIPKANSMATSLRHSAAKRRRLAALDAAVSTIALPGLGVPNGISVLADGTRLVSKQNTITAVVVCTVAGQAPGKGQAGFINGGRRTHASKIHPAWWWLPMATLFCRIRATTRSAW
jgi:hypothetical protein